MKYDRQKDWNQKVSKIKVKSFITGYNMVMRAQDWKYYEDIPNPKTEYVKGINAGLEKRKEKEMEALLTGEPYIPPPHHSWISWEDYLIQVNQTVDGAIERLLEQQTNRLRGK